MCLERVCVSKRMPFIVHIAMQRICLVIFICVDPEYIRRSSSQFCCAYLQINEAQEKKSHDPTLSGNVLEGSTADAITAAAATQQPAQEEKKKDDIRAGAKDRLGNARVLLRRFGTGRGETGPENGLVDPTPEPKTEAHKSDTKEHRFEQLKSADKVADEMKETHNLVKVNTERPQLTPRAGPSAAGMVVAAAASSLSSISSAPSSMTSPPRALTPRQQVLVTAAWRLAQEAEAEKRAEDEKILLSKVEEDLAIKERQAASAAAAAAAAAAEKTIEVEAPTTHIQESPERAAAEERRRKQEKALRAHKEVSDAEILVRALLKVRTHSTSMCVCV